MEGIIFVAIAVGVLLFVAPLGIWNRLIKIHGEMKRAVALLERIAAALEGRAASPSAPSQKPQPSAPSGRYARKWMS